ncbi:hypothetical protein ACK2GQ_02435 [Clostridioides difficile]
MWILVPIITIVLLIIAVSSMQYILVMIAFLLIIYSFIEKKIVMGLVSVLFSLIQFIFVQLGKINP